MSETRVRVGSAGRFVIPSEYRQALGIRTGDEVIVVLEPGEIRITTVREAIKRAQQMVRKHLRRGDNLVDELLEERRKEARRD